MVVRVIIVPSFYAVEHYMRLLAFDAGVAGAGGFGLLVMQLLADAGVLGGASGLGEQLGVAGLVAVTVAIMLLRREVNRILKAVEVIHSVESRVSKLEGRVDDLIGLNGSNTGRHRRRATDQHED